MSEVFVEHLVWCTVLLLRQNLAILKKLKKTQFMSHEERRKKKKS